MLEISLLRTSALLVGGAVLAVAVYRLRRYHAERTATGLAALAGIVLVLFGAFPSLASLPAALFSLRDEPGVT